VNGVAEESRIGTADERVKRGGFSLGEIGFCPHLFDALLRAPERIRRWVNGDEARLASLTGQFFCNQPCDRARPTGHVHNRQWRTRRACHQRCEGLLNQRTVDCGIKRMRREGFKVAYPLLRVEKKGGEKEKKES